MFFHKFFAQKYEKEQARAGKAGKRKGKREDDAEEDDEVEEGSGSDPEEAEIWKVSMRVLFGLVALTSFHRL